MINNIWVRLARPNEARLVAKWMIANQQKNNFNPDAVLAPSTIILCAFDKNGPLVFIPMETTYVMDSLAIRPGATQAEIGTALRMLACESVSRAFKTGVNTLHFVESAPETVSFASKHFGFEPYPCKVHRLILSDLEFNKEK